MRFGAPVFAPAFWAVFGGAVRGVFADVFVVAINWQYRLMTRTGNKNDRSRSPQALVAMRVRLGQSPGKLEKGRPGQGLTDKMNTATIDFEADLAATAKRVDSALAGLLAETAMPEGRLADAMRHAALGGGKRLRPYLVLASAELFAVPEAAAMPVACALELLHCYSLVHDDLPAMDDDDLRRGQPTVHRAYDEATAILAGDALLTLAFEAITTPGPHADPASAATLVHTLARAAGAAGMAEGQMQDLAAEGRFSADGRPLTLSEREILGLQALKTGALFRFSAEAGAILGKANPEDQVRLVRYGTALGRAFQIADDLLDEEASPEELGKATAKDRAKGKATLPAIIGIGAARTKLAEAVSQARETLVPFGDRASRLRAAADFAASRRS